MSEKIAQQIKESLKGSGFESVEYINYFVKLTTEMNLENFDKRVVLDEYNRRFEEQRLHYLKIVDVVDAKIDQLGSEVSEAFYQAYFGYQKGEFHPEAIVFKKSAVYLQNFLNDYSAKLDDQAINTIKDLIRIANKVRNLDL